ncbi:glycosyltransferase family protein [Marinimicrobium agarilyticum]|uniref:glycosyltransferase family protein n=1 Tax=Marinimicrobium agarilyticum TaxID=306546 RepID=UPI0003F88E5E|nr:glycosyltransferase [Marinimicrobium agarilyticum]
MDALLQQAIELAKQGSTPYLPIPGRIAYVVSHGQSYASNGYAIRTQGIAKALNDHGLETLCFVRQGRPWDLGVTSGTNPEMLIDGVRYIHTRWPNNKRPKTEAERLEVTADKLEQLFRIYRPEKVLVASNYAVGLPAWIAAQRLNLPFYNEVRGFWELSRDAREPGYAKTPQFKAEAERDVFVAQQAERVFTLNEPMKHELAQRGVEQARIELAPNGIECIPETKIPDANLQKSLGIEPNDKVVAYIGSQTEYEGLDLLFDACEYLVNTGQSIKLLFVGDKQPLNHPKKQSVTSDKVPWLIQAGRVQHEHMADYYALANVIAIPRKNLPVCQLVPPIKVVEALSYKKPLVLSDIAPLQPYSEAFSAATSFEADSASSLSDAIQVALKKTESSEGDIKALLFTRSVAPMVKALTGRLTAPIQHGVPREPASFTTLTSEPISQEGSANPGQQKLEAEPAPPPFEQSTHIEISRAPMWFNFDVDELVPHTVSGKLEFSDRADISKRACITRVEYQDESGKTIPGPYNGLASSKQVGPFSYLNVTSEKLLQIVPPLGARRVALGIQTWNAQSSVRLTSPIQCISQLASKEKGGDQKQNRSDMAAQAAKRAEAPARSLRNIKIAAILDEFTMECFRHEVQLTALSPQNWEAEIETSQPDMLFVESCWFGNANQWSGLMYGYTSNGPNKMDELIQVIAYCRKKGVPTVFWAKEDPVHYKRFGPTAKLFDYVYTTDANMVTAYREDFGIDAEPLSFFCQPQVHNPSPIIARNHKAAFAGSYYSDKIERCENFHTIMQGLEEAGVDYDIYDRCLKRGVAHLQFPEHFKKHVVGYLEPHEMWKAYKGYRFTVNLNTVKHSPTMFARRVYESLASGTPVISNYSEGVITQFGGIVCASDSQKEVSDYLNRLKEPAEYQAISEQGVRETLGRHTLADRLEQVCERLGIPVIPHLPIANAVYTASTEAEVERARAHFQQQGYHRKRLVVNLENSNVLYPYLNLNNEEEIFRVLTEFAKPLDGIEVDMAIDGTFPATHLEDQAIKTQYQAETEQVHLQEAVV